VAGTDKKKDLDGSWGLFGGYATLVDIVRREVEGEKGGVNKP